MAVVVVEWETNFVNLVLEMVLAEVPVVDQENAFIPAVAEVAEVLQQIKDIVDQAVMHTMQVTGEVLDLLLLLI